MKRSHCHNVVFLIILGRSSWKGVIPIFYKNFLVEFEPILKRNGLFGFSLLTPCAFRLPTEDTLCTMLSALCFFRCLKAEGRSSNLKAQGAAPRARQRRSGQHRRRLCPGAIERGRKLVNSVCRPETWSYSVFMSKFVVEGVH